MELRSYLEILNRRKLIIFISLLCLVIAAVVLNLVSEPIYVTKASLRVAAAASYAVDYRYYDRLMNTYITIAVSEPVLEELRQRVGIDQDYLLRLDVEALPETELLEITAQASRPLLAQILANTLAQILVEQNEKLYAGGSKSAREILAEQLTQASDELDKARRDLENYGSLLNRPDANLEQLDAIMKQIDFKERTYELILDRYEQARLNEIVLMNAITVVEPAEYPLAPEKPNKALNLALGILLGLIFGGSLAFTIDNLDTTLQDRPSIEKLTPVPILAEIPDYRKKLIPPLKIFTANRNDSNNHIDNSIKLLRLRLLDPSSDASTSKTILVTSTTQGEGKSTIVVNLATSFAKVGRSVAIVDCDLDSPQQHVLWGLPNHLGFTNVINEGVTIDTALQWSTVRGLQVITSGPINFQYSEVLSSQKIISMIEELKSQFDFIFFDAAGLMALSETSYLAKAVDQVLFITAQGQIPRDLFEQALRGLSDIQVQPNGIVINRSTTNKNHYYHNPG